MGAKKRDEERRKVQDDVMRGQPYIVVCAFLHGTTHSAPTSQRLLREDARSTTVCVCVKGRRGGVKGRGRVEGKAKKASKTREREKDKKKAKENKEEEGRHAVRNVTKSENHEEASQRKALKKRTRRQNGHLRASD